MTAFSILGAQIFPFPTKNGCEFMIERASHVLCAELRFGGLSRQQGARSIVQIASVDPVKSFRGAKMRLKYAQLSCLRLVISFFSCFPLFTRRMFTPIQFKFMRGTLAAVLISTSTLTAATRYVDVNGANPAWPYDDWSVAASTIQDAIDAANPGDLILVTNGIYASGGRIVTGSLMSRVVVDKAVTVQSVNGPAATVIAGNQVPGTLFGDGGIRCVYLTNNAALVGFTLTNGATRGATASTSEKYGGGIYSRSSTAVVSNCVIVKNAAAIQGGGVYQGRLFNCTLINNVSTNGGGAYGASLMNCTLAGNQAFGSGGGAYSSMLTNSWLWTNWAGVSGGGVYSGAATNCTLGGNSSGNGGGAYSATVMNCVLTTNVALGLGGGANGGILTGSTLAGNSASTGGGSYSAAVSASFFTGNISTNGGGGVNGGMVTNSTFTSNVVVAGNGGGASSATLVNCLLMNNSAFTTPGNESWTAGNGGGAYGGTLLGCALVRNFAKLAGGGASGCTLNNCTLVANTASAIGGGTDGATLNNCVVFYNSAALGVNYNGGTLNYCCTTPLPMAGNGNISTEPLLADAFHLSGASPCRAAGNASYASGKDIDGELWASPPSMGCDEFNAATAGALSVTIQADYTNVAVVTPLNFSASVSGKAAFNWWNFGDGTVVSNRPYTAHAWSSAGDYLVTFRAFNNDYPAGVSATMVVHVVIQPVHYVAIGSPNPTLPYQSWATAARNIQDAIDAATVSGAKVVVSNGVYATGGRVIYGALTNRVAVTMPLALQSVNGPAVTVVGGNPILGDSAVRCAYLANGASLTGFTLTNGATRAAVVSNQDPEQCGAGIWCGSPLVTVSNSVIVGNVSIVHGAGAYSGILNNCVIRDNVGTLDVVSIAGDAAYGAVLNECLLASNYCDGISYSRASNCTITGNRGNGANNSTLNDCTINANGRDGADFSTLNGCIVSDNSSAGANSSTLIRCAVRNNSGGGVVLSKLSYCTVADNSAPAGGGAVSSTLDSCIVAGNHSGYQGGGLESCVANSCLLIGNVAGSFGGGAYNAKLSNCTIVSNTAAGSSSGGGASGGALTNCYNSVNGVSATGTNYSGVAPAYCDTFPMPTNGVGNITNEPAFMDLARGDFHLRSDSPCINAGTNYSGLNSLDLDGRPRLIGARVDLGAYEFQGASTADYLRWLQQYGISTDASSDSADFDFDGLNNRQEWLAGTVPTNTMSALRLLTPIRNSSGLIVIWQSVTSRSYFIERRNSLGGASPFLILATNILGQLETTSFIDTSATNSGPFFYRVGVY
jgi:hypothetical protein